MLLTYLLQTPAVVTIVVAVTTTAAFLLYGARNRLIPPRHALWAVALGGIAFQVAHFAEHLLQAGYWVLHPSEPPWMTPWGLRARDALSAVTDGTMATGMELLHLLGNGLFFAGLIASALLAHHVLSRAAAAPHSDSVRHRLPALHKALWIQGFHLIEHTLLTLTWLWGGRALGFTNAFGIIDSGTVTGWTTRVWAHFILNLVATIYAVVGLQQLRAALGETQLRCSADSTDTPIGQTATSSARTLADL